MKNLELAKVSIIGGGGSFLVHWLADVASLVSILVGCITFVYVATKLYFLLKYKGK